MPTKSTLQRAQLDLREGKSPSTAAGEFVHEEIEHVRQGKHGARSPQQAIAIGLSEARRAGVPLKPPKKGTAKESTRRSAARAYKKGQSQPAAKSSGPSRASRKRSQKSEAVLQREPKSTASHNALSKQARSAAHRRRKAA